MVVEFVPISPCHDAALAVLIRSLLEERGLNIPGTAYFDRSLDSLSAYYREPRRAYRVLLEGKKVIGGVGLAPYDGFEHCCEMQKLYLSDAAQGRGLGYRMIAYIEALAKDMGYRRIYLETHTNLAAAVHIYEKSGYRRIPQPESAVHGAMDHFYLKDLEG